MARSEVALGLLGLPTELLNLVLSFLDPHDLAAFSSTSKFAKALTLPSNQLLWRFAFLQLFDDPVETWLEMLPTARALNASIEAEWDWYFQSRERCIALKTVTTNNTAYREANLRRSTDALVRIIETARYEHFDNGALDEACPSQSIRTLLDAFENSTNTEKIIHTYEISQAKVRGNQLRQLFEPGRPLTRSMTLHAEPMSENASRLHVYFGVTKYERGNPRARAAARRIVYDYETADEFNDYGPFKPDGSGEIDWRMLEALSSSIGYTFDRMVLAPVRVPQGLKWSLPNLIKVNPDCPQDWAGVTRRWMGTYSFLDYSVLHHLNLAFQRGDEPPLERLDEAHGDAMGLNLSLDDTIRDDPRLKTELPVCTDLPVLYFSGQSIVAENDIFSTVRGTASLIPGGRHVRWRFIVRYAGADQWQLEGVQPGGIRSGGVFGRWTHCDHDEDGPVGPFCYFPEDLCILTTSSR